MRSRWQLFTSNLIAFGSWYVVAFLLAVWSPLGAFKALGWSAFALACGCAAGAVIGAAIYAIDLHATHRDVAAGDAQDGARVSLGKLPERACRSADQPAAGQPTVPAGDAPVALPAGSASPQELDTEAAGEPSAADAAPAAGVTAQADIPAVSEPPGMAPAAPDDAVAPSAASAPAADRLADACGEWARKHSAVQVTPSPDGHGLVGRLDHDPATTDFADLIALIGDLADDGLDVSRVAFTQDADGLPASVTFPVSAASPEVSQ